MPDTPKCLMSSVWTKSNTKAIVLSSGRKVVAPKEGKIMEKTIKKVTCLVCNWQSEEESGIENANWHGECLNCPERLLRWDYADGSIAITNSDTDEKIEWEVSA